MTELRFSGQAPSQVAQHFLALLDDVYRNHGTFLEEISALRARIAELEASKSLDQEGANSLLPDVPGCAVYLVSRDGTIQSWSGGAGEVYGYSAAEVLGQPPAMLRPDGIWSVDSASTSHRLRKDGSTFEVYLHHTVLLDKAGQACGRMHVELPLNRQGKAAGGGGL